MPKLLPVTSKQFEKVVVKLGFELIRQVGSHKQYHHVDGRKVTIAMHGKEIPVGTLLAMLRDCEISKSVFAELLTKRKKK